MKKDSDRGYPGLIPDHALLPEERDQFAHQDLVDQLGAILVSGIVSVNIGLFGPWGAGKTGISRRLKDHLEVNASKDVKYVELNALKYSSAPLLRSFMSQVAEQTLDKKSAAKLRERLYENTVSPRVKLPDKWYSAGRNFLIALALLAAAYGVAVWQLSGAAQDALVSVATSFLPTAIPVAALVTFAIRVIPLMSAKIETRAPSEPEQFERAFREEVLSPLGVTGKTRRRLVIFVDELDRCAPQDVAETLETLRTFLHIPGVLCIVAADRQVLEQALTKRVRQATPVDVVSPYYSAGSAYLDKIFELQIDLPSLQAARLVDFALSLVADANGVWAETDEVEDIISVLLPVHVQSPRRVKVLLNRYVLAFELARKRHADGRVSPGPGDRAQELAKLVCLRTEFPLFIRDLEDEPRLADLIVRARDELDEDRGLATYEDEQGSGHDPVLGALDAPLRKRAFAYADGCEPVALLLADEEAPEGKDPTAIEQAHGLQLVNYLRKTRNVQDPRRDLIHLESAGSVRGLEPQTAEDLETAALNNDVSRVISGISNLSADDANAALLMLGDRLRTSKGNDADNLVRVLLAAVDALGVELSATAATLNGFVRDHAARKGLPDDLLPGALRLASLGPPTELVDLALSSDAASSPALVRLRLELGERLGESDEHLSGLLARFVCDEPAEIVSLFGGWTRGQKFEDLFAGVVGPLRQALEDAKAPANEEETDEEGTARRRGLARAVGSASDALLDAGDRSAAEQLAVALTTVRAGTGVYHDEERALRKRLAPIQTSSLADATLRACPAWGIGGWREIVDSVDLSKASNEAKHDARTRAAARLLRDFDGSDWSVALEILEDLAGAQTAESAEPQAVVDAFDEVSDQPFERLGVHATVQMLELARRLVELGLLGADRVTARKRALARDLLTMSGIDDEIEMLEHFVTESLSRSATDDDLAAIATSKWLTRSAKFALRISATPDGDPRRPTPADVAQLISDEGNAAVDAVVAWLKACPPDGEETWAALGGWLTSSIPLQAREAVTTHAGSLTTADLTLVIIRAARGTWPEVPSADCLEALNTSRADQGALAAEIGRLANSLAVSQREPALKLWKAWKVSDPNARKTLIEEVLHPLISGGKTSYAAVRRNLDVATQPPTGTKTRLVEALEKNAPDEKSAKDMKTAMERAGLKPKRKRGFGPFRF